MIENPVYLYLLSPLHTGGTTQEGNLLGIAREAHTELPYIPSSTIRGRLRSTFDEDDEEDGTQHPYAQRIKQVMLFGPDLEDTKHQAFKTAYKEAIGASDDDKVLENLEQGALWIGDGAILWMPVPSLSHGVIWVSCPYLLQRWARLTRNQTTITDDDVYCTNLGTDKPVYLKDAILKPSMLKGWDDDKWQKSVPQAPQTNSIKRVLLLPDQHCATLFQMSLWRQVKVKLDSHKTVDGGFRYEEAIPPDTLMYFPWGTTVQANGNQAQAKDYFHTLVQEHSLMQIGGQEGLGRGFVEAWLEATEANGGNGNV